MFDFEEWIRPYRERRKKMKDLGGEISVLKDAIKCLESEKRSLEHQLEQARIGGQS